MRSTAVLLAFVSLAAAFPTLVPGELHRGPRFDYSAGGPVIENRAAAPYSPKYPYTGAKPDQLPGTGIGGVQVPAPGDTAHYYQHPPVGAIRGPCPGLNTMANHGFLSRDGLTNLDELIAAQQNVWNFNYDLAYVFATLAVGTSGDIHTGKMSIGADATWLTSAHDASSQPEVGMNGHNVFESDTSFTRNDYNLGGDDYTFNGTLWQGLIDTAKTTSNPKNPLLDWNAMSLYRTKRYAESLATNGNFFFGPRQVLVYAAAAIVYSVMPNFATGGIPDLGAISSIFGAVKAKSGPGNATGGWDHVPERLPPNWYNRKDAWGLPNITAEVVKQYTARPLTFGQNHGVNNFTAIDVPLNKIRSNATAIDVICNIWESLTDVAHADSIPDTPKLLPEVYNWIHQRLDSFFPVTICKPF